MIKNYNAYSSKTMFAIIYGDVEYPCGTGKWNGSIWFMWNRLSSFFVTLCFSYQMSVSITDSLVVFFTGVTKQFRLPPTKKIPSVTNIANQHFAGHPFHRFIYSLYISDDIFQIAMRYTSSKPMLTIKEMTQRKHLCYKRSNISPYKFWYEILWQLGTPSNSMD